MTSENGKIRDLIEVSTKHMFATGEIDKTKRYLESGRPYENVSDADLYEAYIHAFTLWSVNINDTNTHSRVGELSAELDLRELPTPDDHIRAELALIQKQLFEQFSAAEPEMFQEMARKAIEGYKTDEKSRQ